jgi:hypothetical protein
MERKSACRAGSAEALSRAVSTGSAEDGRQAMRRAVQVVADVDQQLDPQVCILRSVSEQGLQNF